ncbi:DNA/RNA polymerase [Eremomyces bilateralis CBS 781.70]|uniref:DNA/RNA polymerase n=1 Tax=Eremomyces bilateralis CBS 781.70 TaxID=1392243 RepID=A0A6G1FTX1_9PEZI|nr:DNA/RNA polymerase [Eremomyces bilateralis CBS 781.70]KAF1809203.1 DNA/RNA polymerase [Eremomyces bilateralis CBS 781.70]
MPPRRDDRIILHFDYDCFYASVFEVENPSLKGVPLAVQQKQIVATCNYEARRRGLQKLQLVTEAKKTCPEVVTVLGEDLTKFRDASKELFQYLRSFSWNERVERLGLDEVFMDVSDIIAYNMGLLNYNDLRTAFFNMSRSDPTVGFSFDASVPAGHTFPEQVLPLAEDEEQHWSDPVFIQLRLRLHLASHLAQHLRLLVEKEKGYTSTVGVSTSKLLSKLAGNVHKPSAGTTLMPPYADDLQDDAGIEREKSNVRLFLSNYEVGLIPGIGHKMAHALRSFTLGREAAQSVELNYHKPSESVTVSEILKHPDANPIAFERLLSGHGAQRGIGTRVWQLLNGCDDSDVSQARDVPRGISIEDSYQKLEKLEDVHDELLRLTCSLVKRMRVDLVTDIEPRILDRVSHQKNEPQQRRWLARPKTVRLSTRDRFSSATNTEGERSWARTSRSCPLPSFIFDLGQSVPSIAEQFVTGTLENLFRKLHPDRFCLSLINVGVTDMDNEIDIRRGRDISTMFKTQNDRLSGWRIDTEIPQAMEKTSINGKSMERSDTMELYGSEEDMRLSQSSTKEVESLWQDEDEVDTLDDVDCTLCEAKLPAFAMAAHLRFHRLDS